MSFHQVKVCESVNEGKNNLKEMQFEGATTNNYFGKPLVYNYDVIVLVSRFL